MSKQQPRRLSEYNLLPDNVRQSRPSRILNPGFATNGDRGSFRASSADRQSSVNKNTPATKHRSSSVNAYRTPLKTPMRPTPSKAQQCNINDKRWLQDQVAKISEYLKTPGLEGITADFCLRGGLKTMTIKQFIVIINHFLKFVAGNKLTVDNNYVEVLPKILHQIGYPHTINKSILKTPTTTNSFGNIISIFTFLMEFIPSNSLDTFKESYLTFGEEFPDMEYTLKFHNMTEEGFTLWNNQKNEEFEKLQKIAIDELISKRSGFANIEALDAKILELENKFIDLKSKPSSIDNDDEDECIHLHNEVNLNKKEIQNLQQTIHEGQNTLKSLQDQFAGLQEQIKNLEKETSDLKRIIDNQKISVAERNKIIHAIDQSRLILKAKGQEICDVQELANKTQITLSRHMKSLSEQVSQFNKYACELLLYLDDFNISPEDFCLSHNSGDEMADQISRIAQILDDIQTCISNQIETSCKDSDQFECQAALIFTEIAERIEPKIKDLNERIEEHTKNIKENDREIILIESFLAHQTAECRSKINYLDSSIDSKSKSIADKKKKLDDAKEENSNMMTLIRERFKEVLSTRDNQLNAFEKSFSALKKKLTEAKIVMQIEK